MKNLVLIYFLLTSICLFGQSSIIIKQKNGKKLEVAKSDLEGVLTWKLAKTTCANLEAGWRIPTIEELNEIYLNKDKISKTIELLSGFDFENMGDQFFNFSFYSK